MQYKKSFEQIMRQLTAYKRDIDSLASLYLAECEEREGQLEGMKGKYTPEYIAETCKNWKLKKDYAKDINTLRTKYRKTASEYMHRIEKEINGYFSVPVSSGFASTVAAIKTVGATLSNREFELLQNSSNGYWGRRLLSELAVSRTIETDKTVNDNGKLKNVKSEEPRPFHGVEVPDIETAYDSLQNVKNAVGIAFDSYCGANYELRDFVFPESRTQAETNEKLKNEYGVHVQNQKPDTFLISRMAGCIRCFDRDYPSYAAFTGMMDKIAATVPEPEKKTSLTDNDRQLIDAMIDSQYPTLAAGRAVEIAKADARLGEILALDERYGQAVREALNIEEYREPDSAKESDISETAIHMARQSARRAAEAEIRGRQALEYYGSNGRTENGIQDN